MPFIPRKQKRRAYIAPKKKFQRKVSNSKFYAKPRWRKTRKVYINKNPFCQICLWQNKVSEVKVLDHIIPMSKGGSHTYSNVQTLCRECNGIKGDKIPIGIMPTLFFNHKPRPYQSLQSNI